MLLLFFICWIIFAGDFTFEIAVFGILVSIAVFTFQCKFLDYSIQKEKRLYRNILWGIGYAVILVLEILKSNIGVLQLILSPKYEVEPKLVRFRTDLKTDLARVILANSITLTPGTITVTLEGDEYLVHCLDGQMAEGMDDSIFVHLLHQLEKKEGVEQ
ncbi:MAG: Na+/H+ antiporter subunit E [Lachnospiraceae bacterium]|nr:Na+/H+ antiporter subunit E [Lachnospiraceae bacterium]